MDRTDPRERPVGASLSSEQVERFTTDLATLLKEREEPLEVPHRVWAVVARKP